MSYKKELSLLLLFSLFILGEIFSQNKWVIAEYSDDKLAGYHGYFGTKAQCDAAIQNNKNKSYTPSNADYTILKDGVSYFGGDPNEVDRTRAKVEALVNYQLQETFTCRCIPESDVGNAYRAETPLDIYFYTLNTWPESKRAEIFAKLKQELSLDEYKANPKGTTTITTPPDITLDDNPITDDLLDELLTEALDTDTSNIIEFRLSGITGYYYPNENKVEYDSMTFLPNSDNTRYIAENGKCLSKGYRLGTQLTFYHCEMETLYLCNQEVSFNNKDGYLILDNEKVYINENQIHSSKNFHLYISNGTIKASKDVFNLNGNKVFYFTDHLIYNKKEIFPQFDKNFYIEEGEKGCVAVITQNGEFRKDTELLNHVNRNKENKKPNGKLTLLYKVERSITISAYYKDEKECIWLLYTPITSKYHNPDSNYKLCHYTDDTKSHEIIIPKSDKIYVPDSITNYSINRKRNVEGTYNFNGNPLKVIEYGKYKLGIYPENTHADLDMRLHDEGFQYYTNCGSYKCADTTKKDKELYEYLQKKIEYERTAGGIIRINPACDASISSVPKDDFWQSLNINKNYTDIAMFITGYMAGYNKESYWWELPMLIEDPEAGKFYTRGKVLGKKDKENKLHPYFLDL